MKKKHAIVAVTMLTMLAALCTTASAGEYGAGCPFSNWYNGTAHGGIYIDVKGHYDNPGATQTEIFENVPDERRIVRLYPGIWLGSPYPGRVTNWTITINGHTDSYSFTEPESLPFCDWDIAPEDGTGEHCTVSCTGCGQCSVTYNASLYIVTGNNTITFWTSEQIDQFALLVVYENESMPKMQYWIKEGHVYLAPDDAPYYVDFAETPNTGPIEPDLLSSAEYFTYGCPRPPGKYADEGGCWPCLNGNNLNAPNITYHNGYGNVSYYWTRIPSGYITSASNRFLYSTLPDPSARLWVSFLALKYGTEDFFDTHAPANPYPSIMGIHEGKIIPSCNINVSKLYTYPCTGTGGHTKSIELRENDYLIANGTWNGYIGDYHNITLQNVTGAPYVTLQKDHEYNYTIRTGSYPQIIHEESKDVTGGTITCTKFVDANGKEHNDGIPAIRLE